MALYQGLHQKLQQKLSPQQIQLMKLLQVPTASLEERIKEEIEENPALEMGTEEYDADDEAPETSDAFENEDISSDEEISQDFNEYDDDGEIADYKLKDDHVPELQESGSIPHPSSISLHDMLVEQLRLLNLNPTQSIIAEQIIGSIDDDGYLRRDTNSIVDDLAFKQNIETSEKEVEMLIASIQLFDPPGIAARDVRESLLIQLRRKLKLASNAVQKIALRIIDFHFDEFTKRHFEKIIKSLEISEDQLKDAISEIKKLNPRPGAHFDSVNKAEQYIVPDFFVYNNNGKPELTLNQRNAPELKVSEEYRGMLKDYEKGSKKDKRQKEAVTFIKQKIDAAKWFIDAIKQRQHTLIITMQAIIDHQNNFFITGDETALRPMILRDIAEKTDLDISTISRVANSKFVQTEFGSFRLKHFFSESLSTDSGEEVSTREVKTILQEYIDAEDKHNPLSDDVLTEMLQAKGYNIARRTVAKYRELLNIPVARLRKEL
ncbi:MAG: RNA polymerase sigma-54 factor [Chitinophagia bacterium]|nr:RNA polymerase sigma-54 factor [Chitinophagia bacterium]